MPWISRSFSQAIRQQQALHPKDVIQDVQALTSASIPPSNSDIVQCLNNCKALTSNARQSTTVKEEEVQGTRQGTASSSLSLLEETHSRQSFAGSQGVGDLSDALYKLIKAPQIFLSPEVLALYIDLQSCLGRPETLPAVLNMFANKAIPIHGSSPLQVRKQNPRSIKAAVPPELANKALDAAVEARELSLCLDVIEETTRQPAYLKRKFITQAWPLAAGAGLTPPFAYFLATKFSAWQTVLSESSALWSSFIAICCYTYCVSAIGTFSYITRNDHHERISWQDGIPLWERWAREDERAMMEKVAAAWGFKEKDRRGEEEGEEWEALKELTAMRDMLLDRTELMENME